MSRVTRTFPILVLAATLAGGAHAGVRTVGQFAGPGIDYLSIQAAIDASFSGDIIVVKGGSFDGFTVDDKQLTITAELGATVSITGQMKVQFLGPDRRVVLRGLTTFSGPPNLAGLHVLSSQGVVWLENLTIKGGFPQGNGTGAPGMLVEDSARVVLLRSTITGGGPKSTGAFPDAGTGLVLNAHSNVVAYESNFNGLNGKYHDDRGGDGGDGVRIESGSFEGYWCTMKGGNGGASDDDWDGFCGCPDCPIPGSGGDGVEVYFGHSANLVSCAFFPGFAGPFTGFEPMCVDGAPGLPINGTATQSTLVDRALSITSPIRETNPFTVKIEGLPNEMTLLFVATHPALLSAPQFLGNLLAPPTLLLVVGNLPPTGALQFTPTLGTLPPGIEGVDVFVQVGFATGAGVLGPASQLTMLDISS